MPDTMKAVVLENFGGYDAFKLRDVSVPAVGPRQVRVHVHATAINPLDHQIRRGDNVDYVPPRHTISAFRRKAAVPLLTRVGHRR